MEHLAAGDEVQILVKIHTGFLITDTEGASIAKSGYVNKVWTGKRVLFLHFSLFTVFVDRVIFATGESKTKLKIEKIIMKITVPEGFDLDFKETCQSMGTLSVQQLPLKICKAVWNII